MQNPTQLFIETLLAHIAIALLNTSLLKEILPQKRIMPASLSYSN